jgi:aspartate-semialdehyde dehydrogenase
MDARDGPRIGVVGATGAVGRVTLGLLRERGYANVRAFASSRSAGQRIGELEVEEASHSALGAGELDVCLFSVGSRASRELVPLTAAAGTLCVDKSEAFRLDDDVPLIVPEVNGERAARHSGILANPNCCAIPLALVLAPLHEVAGLRRVRVATYQSASGAGMEAMERLRAESPEEHRVKMDWDYDGVEFEEEVKLRRETRKILELPDLPVSATCVRVPVLIGHAEAIWLETDEPLSPEAAERVLSEAPGLQLEQIPTTNGGVGIDDVLVGRVRTDETVENGLALFLVSDNLRKGAALNAIQIMELVLRDLGAGLPAWAGSS